VILAPKIALDPRVEQDSHFAGAARLAWNRALAAWQRRSTRGERPGAARLKTPATTRGVVIICAMPCMVSMDRVNIGAATTAMNRDLAGAALGWAVPAWVVLCAMLLIFAGPLGDRLGAQLTLIAARVVGGLIDWTDRSRHAVRRRWPPVLMAASPPHPTAGL
jgi:hypothetical protein